jgi:phage tail sheath gpL-like
MQNRGRAFVVSLASVALAGWLVAVDASAQAGDPIIGTWTLNVAKSTYEPGPAAKGGTVTFEAAGEGIHVVADMVDGQGNADHTEYTANYDGKDYPLKGVPIADTVSLKRIDANTTERIDKKDGKVVQTYLRKVAPGGKTMTVTHKGIDAKGRPVHNTVVFEKK